MPVPEFPSLTLNNFYGLYDTVAQQDCPFQYSPGPCNNAQFTPASVGCRDGTSTLYDFGSGTDVFDAKLVTVLTTQYLLVMKQDHNLYYFTPASPTAILLYATTSSPTGFQFAVFGQYVLLYFNDGNFGTENPVVWDTSVLPTVQVDVQTILPEPDILQKATATITSDTTNVDPLDEVAIAFGSFANFGNVTLIFTFVAALTGDFGKPGEVLIGATAQDSLDNLKAALNHDPNGEGTLYALGTTNPYVAFTVSDLSYPDLTIEAQNSGASQNGISVSTTSAHLSWGAATFTGGAKFDAADGVAGDVNPGYHAVRVLFRTRTGYISSPSEARVCLVRGESVLPMSGIPLYTGDADHDAAECDGRILIMTAAFGDVEDLDDLLDKETFISALNATYYWALVIENNTDTTATINISDARLIQQTNASDNFQFVSPIPFYGKGIIYHNRIVAIGAASDADGNPAGSTAFISELGSPQTFRGDIGFQEINVDSGGRLTNVFILRNFFYYVKSLGIFTTEDTGDAPDSWPVMRVSEDVGTISFDGVSSASDEEFVVIMDFKGGYLFTGGPPVKLSKDIQTTWETINTDFLNRGKVTIDTVNRRIYWLMPLDDEEQPSRAIVCDYFEGWSKLKWSPWFTADDSWRALVIMQPNILIFHSGHTVRVFDPNEITDNGTAIDFDYRTGNAVDKQLGLHLYGGLDMHVEGSGNLELAIYAPDGTLIKNLVPIQMTATPNKDLTRLMNIRTERAFLQFGHNNVNASSRVNMLAVYLKPDGFRVNIT